jgi:membrane-associated phospholipid phosphatase
MLASATVTSVLRVVADKHYTSDVLIGAVLGFGFGFGLPMLLHYRGESRPTPTTTTASTPQMFTWGSTF